MVCLFVSPKHCNHWFSWGCCRAQRQPEKSVVCLFKDESWERKSFVCCVVLLILCCSAYLCFSFSPTYFTIVRTSMAWRECLPPGPYSPHPPLIGDGNRRPPRWTTCGGWLQGFPSLFEALSAQTSTAGGQERKAEAAGEQDPAGLHVAGLQLRWMEFTVCGSRLIHGCLSRPHPGCLSTPWGLLVRFGFPRFFSKFYWKM